MSLIVPASATVYLMELADGDPEGLRRLLNYLTPSELVRYQKFARSLRGSQFLAGRFLARHAVATSLQKSVRQIEFVERLDQAPLLFVEGARHSCGFSISHSGSWVACACSASASLGLDIEILNPARSFSTLVARIFDEVDQAWWARQPDQVGAFYTLWSRREARYKLQQHHGKAAVEFGQDLDHPSLSMVLMGDRELVVQVVTVSAGELFG